MKKLFITATILLLLLLMFLLFYNFIFKADRGQDDTTVITNGQDDDSTDVGNGSNEPILIGDGAIIQVTDDIVLSPVVSEDGRSILYYAADSGKAYSVVIDGSRKASLSDDELANLLEVQWASNQTKVISKFREGEGYKFFYYSYITKDGEKLPDDVDLAIWDNLGTKIIYKRYDANNKKREIRILDPVNMSESQLLTDQVPFVRVELAQIPQNSVISFWSSPTAYEETSLMEVGINGGETKEIFSRRFGADYLWSPDGKRCLVSSTDVKGGSKMNLGFFNRQGGQYQGLNIPTFASKAVWSSDGKTVYYALPGSFVSGVVLPDDYDKGNITTSDTFWKVDIETGKKDRIIDLADIDKSYDASELILSPTEKYLFFVNRIDGKLYRLEITL